VRGICVRSMLPQMGTFSPTPGPAARFPKPVIGGSPSRRRASVILAQMDREAGDAEVRAVKAIPLDTRSPLSILWICAPEACLLVGFDWPRTASSIRYSSWLFTAPNVNYVGSGISTTISRILAVPRSENP